MTDREKLIELLKECSYDTDTYEEYADNLIANGVTVQKWIPANEPPKEHGIYCVIAEAYKSSKRKKRTHARYKSGKWLDLYDNWENRCWKVTHWMPMPESPKGD